MNRLAPYAKAVVAYFGAGLYALQTALTDETVTSGEWVGIGLAVLVATGVYAVPNTNDA